jgi:hypothetical protein
VAGVTSTEGTGCPWAPLLALPVPLAELLALADPLALVLAELVLAELVLLGVPVTDR